MLEGLRPRPDENAAYDRRDYDINLQWLEIGPWRPNPKGPPSSLVQLRSAVWTGDARDTEPQTDSCTAAYW